MDMLPASLWHRVFRCLLLPPGSSHPDTTLMRGRRKTPWYLTATMQPPAGRNLPVKFVDPDFSAAGQHRKNVKTYGSGWVLLCCAMVSKRLRNLVLSFSAQHPISLVYNNLHPQWERSVAFFLRHRGLKSLALTFTHIMQLDTIVSQDEWPFASLTSLTLKLRGCPDYSQLFDRELGNEDVVEQGDRDDTVQEHWSHYYGCPRVQRLKLGRGKWVLSDGWAGKLKALRSLTLKHVDWSHMDVKYLATLTPQLTEFTLYEGWDLDNPSVGPRGSGINRFCFDLSSARVLRFYFAQGSLTLFLTLSRSLKAFSAVAKRLVLSCKSAAPLYLDQLSLYGQERLVISSLRLASARVAYLNGPPIDRHSRDDACSSQRTDSSSWDTPAPPPDWLSLHRRSSSEFSWVEWLGAIARTVEVLIVRHGVPVEQVGAEWSCLRSLGIVVESEERFERDLDFERRRDDGEEEVTVEECQERNQRQRRLQQRRRPQQQWQQEEQEEEEEEEQAGKLPVIKAPNLKTIFFPTRTCEQHTLVALRESCPSLALYCIASRSFYWEKHGKGLAETEAPVVHVRKGRSGVSSNCFGERQAKNVREKMHGVNRELVESYSVDKDEAYMLKSKGSLWGTYCSYYL
ncbi:unnamed protein product [Closterium sp. Naga37s-1]|nr:unnamed protein product [Closterium sp. Naga37s-1]CAI5524140.1 unnamed protein product [Closterium sp. Naga37s-1]